MPDTWRQNDLPELAATLARRPGHENTRTLLADILRHAFGAAYAALDHEVRMPEVRGRADMLFAWDHPGSGPAHRVPMSFAARRGPRTTRDLSLTFRLRPLREQ